MLRSTARLIKKYPNRRLYDTLESRYITLDDVQKTVRSGVEVQVIEKKTGEDITHDILLQVAAAENRKRAPEKRTFSTEFLHRLLRMGPNKRLEIVGDAARLAG